MEVYSKLLTKASKTLAKSRLLQDGRSDPVSDIPGENAANTGDYEVLQPGLDPTGIDNACLDYANKEEAEQTQDRGNSQTDSGSEAKRKREHRRCRTGEEEHTRYAHGHVR